MFDKKVGKLLDDASRALIRNMDHYLHVGRRSDMEVLDHWTRRMRESRNPFNRHGAKYYSQHEEDGLLLEITRRLGIPAGTFVELGCGDGLENNTLVLLLSGWRGVWIDAGDLAIRVEPGSTRLAHRKTWLRRENVTETVADGLHQIGNPDVDVVSIDLDGNDLYLLQALLATGLRPRIVILEYNGKFPPPIRFSIGYDPAHIWDGTDYMGASLQSFIDILAPLEYRLVCCNVTGTNAFFVQKQYGHLFPEVPESVSDIFMAPDYCPCMRVGHKTSPRTVERALSAVI
jgi:hypothetical protein